MQQNLQTGSGIKLLINGNLAAFATGINFTRSTNTKVIYEIDSPFAKEIMTTTYAVNGSLTGLRVRGSGGLDGAGIMNASTANAFFTQKYCVIEIVDILSKVTMYTIDHVVFSEDSWNIQNRQLMTFSANFKGIFMRNEVSDKSG